MPLFHLFKILKWNKLLELQAIGIVRKSMVLCSGVCGMNRKNTDFNSLHFEKYDNCRVFSLHDAMQYARSWDQVAMPWKVSTRSFDIYKNSMCFPVALGVRNQITVRFQNFVKLVIFLLFWFEFLNSPTLVTLNSIVLKFSNCKRPQPLKSTELWVHDYELLVKRHLLLLCMTLV